MIFKTIQWKNNRVVLIDQRLLPHEEVYQEYADYRSLAEAIRIMVVRGAPAIGVAAAMGVALGALEIQTEDTQRFFQELETVCATLIATRPTAVNLFWAVERMKGIVRGLNPESRIQNPGVRGMKDALIQEALAIYEEDIALCRSIGKHGSKLLEDGDVILTHCNAGALATAGQGTALSPIYEAKRQGKRVSVFADETRPFLQGARLTAWELQRNGIDVTLIPDVAAASLLREGKIRKILVGADRIAANGDVANKIGTYSVALAAKAHGIPLYVAAPFSTIDWNCPNGSQIPIEERPEEEVTHWVGKRISPHGISVRNPAFDVTPHSLIQGIITERGLALSPLHQSLQKLYGLDR